MTPFSGGKIGPRLLRIVFDCAQPDEAAVQERLTSVSPFATVAPAQAPYRWELKLSLHPITQNRPAKEMVEEVCRKLRKVPTLLPPLVPMAWHDSMENK